MNKLKNVLFMLIAFLGLAITQAQEKETIKHTEKQETITEHDGITYYVIDGLWHTKMKNKYVLKTAPKGAKLKFLPKNGKLVTMAGKKYYKYRGVFYKKGNDYYEVVRL